MEQQIKKIIEAHYDPDMETLESGVIAKEISEMVYEFIEWAATTHIKLHKVWCGLYKDQRNEANWKTTDELFQFWITNIKK